MDEESDWVFVDTENNSREIGVPVFFIYDRTAALNEGDDPVHALLYPSIAELEEEDADSTNAAGSSFVTRQISLIGQIVGLANKLEQELAKSLPVVCRLAKFTFVFLNIGKYTLSLKRHPSYPENVGAKELEMIYFLFSTFYGGFATAAINTTNSGGDNVDRLLVPAITRLMHYLNKINRPQLAACVGSWTFQSLCPEHKQGSDNLNEPEKRLRREVSMSIESACMTHSIIGAMAMCNGKVIFTKSLTAKFVQVLTLIISSDMEVFGNRVEFSGHDTSAFNCYNITVAHTPSAALSSQPTPFYALIHINTKKDLSLTLLVTHEKNPSADEQFSNLWRSPCRDLKDKLLNIWSRSQNDMPDGSTHREVGGAEYQKLKHHKYSNIAYASISGTSPYGAHRRRGPGTPLTQNPQWLDWYTKSISVAQQAFSEMPSITEIRLCSSTDSVLHATQGPVHNTYIGSPDINALPTLPDHCI